MKAITLKNIIQKEEMLYQFLKTIEFYTATDIFFQYYCSHSEELGRFWKRDVVMLQLTLWFISVVRFYQELSKTHLMHPSQVASIHQ